MKITNPPSQYWLYVPNQPEYDVVRNYLQVNGFTEEHQFYAIKPEQKMDWTEFLDRVISHAIGYASFDEKGFWRVEITETRFLKSRKARERNRRCITFRPDRDIYEVKYQLFRIMRDRYRIEPH